MRGVSTQSNSFAPPIFGLVESMRRSEEHTSELQSQSNLVCRLLLEKKKNRRHAPPRYDVKRPASSRCIKPAFERATTAPAHARSHDDREQIDVDQEPSNVPWLYIG